jgi:hypothetical protein
MQQGLGFRFNQKPKHLKELCRTDTSCKQPVQAKLDISIHMIAGEVPAEVQRNIEKQNVYSRRSLEGWFPRGTASHRAFDWHKALYSTTQRWMLM